MKKVLQQFAEVQVKAVISSLPFVIKYNDREYIHKCRLAIKRLRALEKWVDELPTELKDFKQANDYLNKVFGSMGKFRDTQVQLQILDSLDDGPALTCPAFRLHLKDAQIKRSRLLDKSAKKLGLKQIKRVPKQLTKSLEFIDGAYLENYLLHRAHKRINRLQRNPRLEPAKMHSVRKDLKELRYWIELLKLANYHYGELDNSLPVLDSLYGTWHDREMLLKELNQFGEIHRSKSLKFFPEEQHLRKHLRAEQKHLLRTLRKEIRKFSKIQLDPVKELT